MPWNQGVSAADRAAARELFLEGNRRFRIPLFTKAAERYVAALSKWRHPAFYFNLALAQLNLNLEVEARENLEHALQYGKEPLGAEQFQEAQKQLREVEHQLGRIRVSCQSEGAKVTLDGVMLFTGPGSYEGWAKAQDHEVSARKPGHLPAIRRVTISSRELQIVELKLVTLREAANASRRWAVWKPWAVVATGGAIAATGGVLHSFAAKAFKSHDEQFKDLDCLTEFPTPIAGCSISGEDREVPQGLQNLLDRAQRQQAMAVGSYIAGGSVIVTGIALLYLNRTRLERISSASPHIGSTTIMPILSADMFGITLISRH